MSVFFTILTFLFIVISVALVLVILVQRPQGGGLASAFGGGGGTDTAFGGRTGDALTVATVSVFVVYLILAISLNVFHPSTTLASLTPDQKNTATEPAPAAAPESAPIPVATLPMAPGSAPVVPSGQLTPTPVPAPGAAPASPPATDPAAPTAVPPAAPEKPHRS